MQWSDAYARMKDPGGFLKVFGEVKEEMVKSTERDSLLLGLIVIGKYKGIRWYLVLPFFTILK